MSDHLPLIVAAAKWLDLRPGIDRLEAAVHTDARRGGFSPADHAALELALTLAADLGATVRLVGSGPAEAGAALAELGAAGAADVVRVDLPPDADSATVAAALAAECEGAEVVVCGALSLDRGSGSVPALLAHHLRAAQALGLLSVSAPRDPHGPLGAVRRLDGGRREVLSVPRPAVISVEGAVATLRRAPLRAMRHARDPLRVVSAGVTPTTPVEVELEAWRPPPRRVPAPTGADPRSRIVELTGALVERTPPRRIEADPDEAAAAIVEQLRAWGYLE